MADEKRISVSFGAFAVDIEGYDDPFSVLSAVISHIKTASDAPLGEKGFADGDLKNAALLASLSAEAAQLELTGDATNPRLSVKAEPPAQSPTTSRAAPDVDVVPTPETPPVLQDEPPADAPAAPVAQIDTAPREAAPVETADPAPVAPILDPPEELETEPETERTTATAEEGQEDTDEEAAILRRVRQAIKRADEPATETPLPKPKPAAARSPAEQKADVVKDIATTLRRIGARDDEQVAPPSQPEEPVEVDAHAPSAPIAEEPPREAPMAHASATETEAAATPAEPEPEVASEPAGPKVTPLVAQMPTAQGSKPKIRDGATGQLKPKARKPLTMQMQIRPKTPSGTAKPARATPLTATPRAEETDAKPASAPRTQVPAASPTPQHPAEPQSTGPDETLDRDTIRERLVDLAKDDEVIDNFLFDDVETLDVEIAPQTESPAGSPNANATGARTERHAESAAEEETLILTAAEAAPLVLDNPVEPLVLTDPIAPSHAVADDPAPDPLQEVQPIAEETEEPLALTAAAVPEEAPSAKDTKASKSEPETETAAGFTRLTEVRNAPIPMLLEPGTRPKRRNGGPRLVALSDETQFDQSMSPQDFAAHIGASSLHDMLEATAVYMAIVEGRANFSRQDVMLAFARIETSENYSTEQRLKTFRKLLASGALTRVDEREYALSHETRFGYETQLRA